MMKRKMGTCGGHKRRILMILAVTALFVWMANVEIISRGIATSTATTIAGTPRNLRSIHALERKRTSAAAASSVLNLHYYSKRKVPNGPDPIHNRRAGKSREPTGRV